MPSMDYKKKLFQTQKIYHVYGGPKSVEDVCCPLICWAIQIMIMIIRSILINNVTLNFEHYSS